MKVKVKNIHPNPFRNIEHYPFNEKKIASLKDSIGATGFWQTVVGRPKGRSKTNVEIAFGHHRIEAARQLGIEEIEMDVRKLSDEDMLQRMALENRTEYRSTAMAEIESVRQTLTAMAEGKVPSAEITTNVNEDGWRAAPSALVQTGKADAGNHFYSAESLRKFLVMEKSKVSKILLLVEGIERGLIDTNTITEANIETAYAAFSGVVQLDREAEAEAKQAKTEPAKKKAKKKAKEAKAVSDELSHAVIHGESRRVIRSKREEIRNRGIASKAEKKKVEEAKKSSWKAQQERRKANLQRVVAEAKAGNHDKLSKELSRETDNLLDRFNSTMEKANTLVNSIEAYRKASITERLKTIPLHEIISDKESLSTWEIRDRIAKLSAHAKATSEQLLAIHLRLEAISTNSDLQARLPENGSTDVTIDAEYSVEN